MTRLIKASSNKNFKDFLDSEDIIDRLLRKQREKYEEIIKEKDDLLREKDALIKELDIDIERLDLILKQQKDS